MPKIFISYRRDDNKAFVERVHDRLVVAFGEANVFQDVDDGIIAGTKWKDVLKTELDESDVLLIVIGENWERIINERAHLPNDWVRYEVEQGLIRGDSIILIPMLIENTPFPSKLPESIHALGEYQIFNVRGNPDFNRDMNKLAALIKKRFRSRKVSVSLGTALFSLAGLLGSVVAIIASFYFLFQVFNGNYGWIVANNSTSTEEATEPVTNTSEATNAPTLGLDKTNIPIATTISPYDLQSTFLVMPSRSSPTRTATHEPTATNTDRPRDEPTATNTDRPTNTPTDEPTAASSPTIEPSPEPRFTEYEAALESAYNFSGTLNSEWTTYIYTFEDDVEMVLVPVGCFMMGLDEQQLDYVIEELGALESSVEDEYYVEAYCITQPFWLDRTEVTQEDFNRLRGFKRNSNTRRGNDFPVDAISWFEARDYCEMLGKRLPTEAEWEYAARGIENLLFPWGNQLDTSRGNYCDSTCSEPWADRSFYDGYTDAAPVGSFVSGISWVGALDMSGNVDEWTNSLWRLYPYDENDGREGEAPEGTGYFRISRDSSWNHITHTIRATARFGTDPNFAFQGQGFRCARDIEN
jgi:formylglycine-generating enzyme required for sulfatase activity